MEQKTTEKSKKIRELDEKDLKILNILIENGREKLNIIARLVGLSIDSTKKRIHKLHETGVIERFTILPNPKKVGYEITAHIYVKLKNLTEEKTNQFIDHLKHHQRIIVAFSMLGDFDIYFVIIAKDSQDMDFHLKQIRTKFSDIISDWKGATVINPYKIEEYKF